MDGTSPLREHLETLPQELYDMIYDLTFTAEERVVYVLQRKHYPPHLLQVDHHSRQKFTASYYSSTTFLFTSAGSCARWTDALKHVPSTAFRALYVRTPGRIGLSFCSLLLKSVMDRFQEFENILRVCGPCDTEVSQDCRVIDSTSVLIGSVRGAPEQSRACRRPVLTCSLPYGLRGRD